MNLTPTEVSGRLHEIVDVENSNMYLFQCCEDACEIMNHRKKPDTDVNDLRFLTAAAIVAYGRYLLVSNMGSCDISAFKAGDIDIKFRDDNGFSSAEQMINSAFAEIADLLTDTSFSFEAV